MSMLSGWTGYLHADAYSGYDSVILQSNGLIMEVACWTHARRYFEQALPNDSKVCGLVLEWVRQLYDIEDRALWMSDDERLAVRQAETVPILRRMGAWLKVDDEGDLSKKALPDDVLPKSTTGKAVRYLLNNWRALNVFTTDGRLTIDNNLSERTVRALAIGQANWKFIGSEPAGYRMAVLFTIMANAKRYHLEPFAYVRDLLLKMSSLCDECGVDLPDFTEASTLSGPELRERGVELLATARMILEGQYGIASQQILPKQHSSEGRTDITRFLMTFQPSVHHNEAPFLPRHRQHDCRNVPHDQNATVVLP
jgi:transposase